MSNDAVKRDRNPFLWENIKILSNDNKQSATLPKCLKVNDVIVDSKQQVAEELNRHFVNIAKVIEKIECSTEHFINLKQYAESNLKGVSFNNDFINPKEVSVS